MKKTYNFRIIAYFLLITFNGFSQVNDTFKNNITGQWTGMGSLFGQEATFTMHWENILENKFMKLTFMNQFKDKSGNEMSMHANGYYDLDQNKGYWFDSRGMMLPLKLELNENSLTVLWGDASAEKGKTIYTLNKGEIDVQDFVFRNDQYIPFGKANYKKITK